jgi:hypothetical protein
MTDDHATVNPYAVDENEAAGLGQLTLQLNRLMVMTVHVDPHDAGKFAVMTAIGASTHERNLTVTIKALMWELASLMQSMISGRTMVTEYKQCEDPTHDHTSDTEQELQHFGFTTLDAFFDAAGRGDFQGAVNVVDAVAADGTLGDGNAEYAATVMFANAMVSAAMTVRHAVGGDAMWLFTP